MSRSTHDIECMDCGYQGKVVDDSIICPKCGKSVEGQPITGEALAELMKKIAINDLLIDLPGDLGYANKENKG